MATGSKISVRNPLDLSFAKKAIASLVSDASPFDQLGTCFRVQCICMVSGRRRAAHLDSTFRESVSNIKYIPKCVHV